MAQDSSFPQQGSRQDQELVEPRGRWLIPPIILLLTLLIVGGVIAMFAVSGVIEDRWPVIDKAVQNIIAFGFLFLLGLVYLIWFLFFCRVPVYARLLVLLVLVAAVAVFLYLYEFTQNSGSLLPGGIKRRGTPDADERLAEKEIVTEKDVVCDLAYDLGPNEVDRNFHQFFGPQRDGVVPDPRLATDWEANRPQRIWKQKIGAGWSGFSAANGFAVTLEQRGPEELTVCYQINSGKIIWVHAEQVRHESPMGGIGPRSTPTIDPETGHVFSLGATGILACLDGKNGELIWKRDLIAQVGSSRKQDEQLVMWGRAASPLVVGSQVIVPGGGARAGEFASLISYDKQSGEERWRGGDEQISYSSPIIANVHGREMLVIVNAASVTGHDPNSGKVLWRFEREGASNANANTSQPVALTANRFLFTKGYGLGAEVIEILTSEDARDSYVVKQVWQSQKSMRTKMTNAVVKGKYAFGLSDEILECIDVDNGQRLWRNGRYGHGQILLAGDEILVLSEKGFVALVSADSEYNELTQMDAIKGVTWNTPCLHHDDGNWYLLVRNAEEAACFLMPVR